MGKGCGSIKCWISIVKKGSILLEINGVPEQLSKNSLIAASLRLPLKTIVVVRLK
jgi:ribosomal protein L16/L10AE